MTRRAGATRGIILGAGRGTRLGRLGERIPKILVDIGGEPLFQRQIRYLYANGIHEVIVNVHHLADQVERFVDRYGGPGHVRVVREDTLLGTAGAVRNALDKLGAEPFVVLYGDVLLDDPLSPMIATHRLHAAPVTIAVYPSMEVEGKGVVELDEDGTRIVRFNEKSFLEPPPLPAFVNAGVYIMDGRLVEHLKPGEYADFGDDVFPGALRDGVELRAYALPRPVIDVGTPEMLERARALARAPR